MPAETAPTITEIHRKLTSSLRFPAFGDDPAVFSTVPTVTVKRDSDGVTILDEVEATKVDETETDVEHFVVEVAGSDVPDVDLLEVEWTDGANSYTSWCEVVGGFVVSLAAVEKKADLNKPRPKEDVAAMREMALRAIEDACEVAFRRRYTREVLDGSGTAHLFLGKAKPLQIFSAKVGGADLDVSALTLDSAGVLTTPGGWAAGRSNVEIAYAHGYESFPLAALPVRDLAAHLLTPSPQDWNERATSRTDDGTTYALVTAGVRGAEFPLPSVNAFVDSHRFPVIG